jgi:chemotaxis protein MotB
MKKIWFFLVILLLTVIISSCVSLKRHKDLESRHQAVNALKDSCQAKMARLTSQLDVLEQSFNSMKKVNQGLMRDTARYANDLMSARQRIERLNQQNEEIARTSEILRKGTAAEQDQLLKELRETETKLRKREEDLALLEEDVRNREARIQEMQSMMESQAENLNNLRQTISKALLGFEESGLSVRVENARVYVSLSEKLMFKVGSADVDPKGRQAIIELGKVLAGNPDINIMVEGHTDDQGGDALNWDLSVRRATSIVKILVENPQIAPSRITAAGRGKHLPVEPGKTTEARTRNRRTEIILTPQLNLLFQYLEPR